MMLFICHASEDKADFVRPLAERLQRFYDVWYDEYQLRLGDSLLDRINEGIRVCDFGVVVFSPAFLTFSKWARSELAALFSRESRTRKVILPIRKDLTPEQLGELLPLFADRVSVSASSGLEAVVEQIRLAVDVSMETRKRTIREAVTQRALNVDQELHQTFWARDLLAMARGAELVRGAIQSLFDALETELSQISTESHVLKFKCTRLMATLMYVFTAFRISLGLVVRDLASNSAVNAVLICTTFLRSRETHGETAERIQEFRFTPTIRVASSTVVWVSQDERVYANDELIAFLIEKLIFEVEAKGTEEGAVSWDMIID